MLLNPDGVEKELSEVLSLEEDKILFEISRPLKELYFWGRCHTVDFEVNVISWLNRLANFKLKRFYAVMNGYKFLAPSERFRRLKKADAQGPSSRRNAACSDACVSFGKGGTHRRLSNVHSAPGWLPHPVLLALRVCSAAGVRADIGSPHEQESVLRFGSAYVKDADHGPAPHHMNGGSEEQDVIRAIHGVEEEDPGFAHHK